jgi:hypothetical protein
VLNPEDWGVLEDEDPNDENLFSFFGVDNEIEMGDDNGG